MLSEVLKERSIDVLVLFSSLTAVTGGIGQGDYCAANAFLDAFAASEHMEQRRRTVVVDWDAWQWDSWQEKALSMFPALQVQLRKMRQEGGISFSEGTELLNTILQLPFPQVLVSARSIQAAVETHDRFSHTFWADDHAAEKHSASTTPEAEIEEVLTVLWQEALGVEHIGVHESFIELGGHSLMAIKLVARIRERFQIDMPLQQFFRNDTIARLAAAIREALYGDQDAEELDRILAEIEGLSEDEVNEKLAEAEQRSGR